jgi:hypothetical protein
MDKIELRITVIPAQHESVISAKPAVYEYCFGCFMDGTIMPDSGWSRMRNEFAILGPGPATRTVKINASLHDAVFKIPHPIIDFPGTDRVATE